MNFFQRKIMGHAKYLLTLGKRAASLHTSSRYGPVERERRNMENIAAKVASLSIATLKDMAARLNTDFRDGADLVQSAVLAELMARLPEAEFVSFCDAL